MDLFQGKGRKKIGDNQLNKGNKYQGSGEISGAQDSLAILMALFG